jgi:hypothetical protein
MVFDDFYGNIKDADLLATLDARLATLMRDGNLVRGPGFRSLGDGLFEVKAKTARVLYGFLPGARIVVVEACYKDQPKPPPRVIATARDRIKQAKSDGRFIYGQSYIH